MLLLALGVCEAQINPLNVMIFDELNRLRHGVLRVARDRLIVLGPLNLGDAGANTLPRQPASQGSNLHASAPCWVFCLNPGLSGRQMTILRKIAHLYSADN
ncbi:hypothetical protein ALO52_100568 [Pseudomonas syringae pv. primulae]|uniref:Uncharacterized protein n=1 Tax=Pseudomonas syringae pv. primulae TaxID=251707 RepID=A0A0N8SKJ9_9PSED|nr:hypothetical protein ALO52_100568 [Pseudomonas syringae pv. primulae]